MSGMSLARAARINRALVDAWMVQTGVSGGPVAPFLGITVEECVEATRIVQGANPSTNGGGRTIYSCVVDPSRIPGLYAWAVLRSQM